MAEKKKNLVYLTGFMGSGKSTIAPILANTLGYNFVDIDAEVERLAGKKISDIFVDDGENYFRKIERDILRDVSKKCCYVISLGGGTVVNEGNLQLVKSSGVLVYLKTSSDQIFKRMRFKTDRPLLKKIEGASLSDSELQARIMQLIEAREPFYQQSHITIFMDNYKIGKTVDEIVKLINPLIE